MDPTFKGRLRPKQKEPLDWADLTKLPNEKMAFIYERLSTHEQIKKSIYSIKAQDALVDLAKEDGYSDSQIHIEKRDLGISGTKGREEREGLAYLVQQVEADQVEAIYVIHISRLYRDQTLINAFALGELFKEHNVIIVTPQMRLNIRDKMHMRLYRMEVERAADELELMGQRLLGARNIKARTGYYAGEAFPVGYVIDERKQLEDGKPNPDFHTFQIYEPHANIVRIIFLRLVIPGMTPIRVARYLKEKGIAFPPFSAEFYTKPNLKTFSRTKRNPDNSWIITVSRVRSIATNPAYIGWRFWEGEIVSKNDYPPTIDEAIFWAVQKKFKKNSRPKKDYEPLPLAGLLYCGDHDVSKEMGYANRKQVSYSHYQCFDSGLQQICTAVSAYVLNDPISEVVISQITLPGLARQVLEKLTSEYEQAKEYAASYLREAKRLEAEIENLRNNLATGTLSTEQVGWIDKQIQNRLERIKELADLEKQPIGAIGKPVPEQADIELVEAFLNNLPETWPNQPNSLKNVFLRLLLDKVVIHNGASTINAKIIWRVGLKQEILIHKPFDKDSRSKWRANEEAVLCQHYKTASKVKLMAILPGRSWMSIRSKAKAMRLRKDYRQRSPDYTPEEDEIIRRYCAGEISQEELAKSIGRDIDSIKSRAYNLGLLMPGKKLTWEWIDKGGVSEEECSSGTTTQIQLF